eukprot:TRINITY_DN12790_c0_g1_i1.p1 TRINITY_DN12790_c0_g1~~TRINITY_DN12790_c0_g1_i1.p1  ORF type:complete len:359 (-),score=35.73 TRINITY_DN12790_c0_g1_i1:359-1435(-)
MVRFRLAVLACAYWPTRCHSTEKSAITGNVPLEAAVPSCLVEPTYTAEEIVVQRDIVYGTVWNPYNQTLSTLQLDAYSPPPSDRRTNKPAVVVMHGGTFIMGDKTWSEPSTLARNFARTGYVAFSINYRLAPLWEMANVKLWGDRGPLTMAYEDLQLSLRTITKYAANFSVDVDRLGIAGHSAGALTMLYYGYVPEVRDIAALAEYKEKVNVVLAMSGAANATALCKAVDNVTLEPINCTFNSPPNPNFLPSIEAHHFINRIPGRRVPLFQTHGTADVTIPYKNGLEAHTAAAQHGVPTKLISLEGQNHNAGIRDLLNLTNRHFFNVTEFFAQALNLTRRDCPRRGGGVDDEVTNLFV